MTKVQPETIVMIGAGNLATSLAPALRKTGFKILQVYSRTKESAVSLANKLNCDYTNSIDKIRNDADIYFLVLTDNASLSFINEFCFPNTLIVHTSGGLDMSIFEKYSKSYGVFYPVQTFSKNVELDFWDIPICIEASNSNIEKKLLKIAKRLSGRCVTIDSAQRKYLHTAAVFACNFVNHMYEISSDILGETELPFNLLHPLIRETAEKVMKNSPHEVQTGPARRNDRIVINEHLKLLASMKHYQDIYNELSLSIISIYKEDFK